MAVGFPTKANWAAGDILTAAQMDDLAGTVNTLANVPPRNAVLNSAMNVWQRGTSISLAASTGYASAFSADRWDTLNGANQALTISRQATNDTTNLPNIQYCLRFQRNSGQTGTSTITLAQSFETLNSVPFSGKAITFSFYARAGANYSATSNALTAIVWNGTGTDQNILPGYTGQAQTLNFNATLTTTWQRFTGTATVPASSTELAVGFLFTPTGTAGANDYFEITGVQLELGSTASTYYPNQPTYATELAACQRYYLRYGSPSGIANENICLAIAGSTTGVQARVIYPVQMRVAPTSIDYSNVQLYDGAVGYTTTTCTFDVSGLKVCSINITGATGLTQFRTYAVFAGSTTGYLGLSAEL